MTEEKGTYLLVWQHSGGPDTFMFLDQETELEAQATALRLRAVTQYAQVDLFKLVEPKH